MNKLRSPLFLGFLILASVYLIVIPLWLHDSPYFLGLITTCSVLSFISMGVWITFSLGLINIGQGAFCLIGAYTTGILSTKLGVSIWLSLPMSGFVAALIGVLIGMAILRLRGVYFAMITIIFGEAVKFSLMNGGKLTGGASGIWDIPKPGAIHIFGWTLIQEFKPGSYLSFYFLAAFLLIAVLLAFWRLRICRLGWIVDSLRQSDTLSSSLGIDIAKYRIIAFGIACFVGGLGGSFFATYLKNINPNSFTVWDSINFLLYCFLGGLEYLLGPIVGTSILVGSFEALRVLQKYQALLYACVMIAAILWLPNGILSIRLRFRKKAKDQTGFAG